MNTASNLHAIVAAMRKEACEYIPGLSEQWTGLLITDRGELLLADTLRQCVSKIFMPNSGNAFKFTFKAYSCPLPGVDDGINIHFDVLFPFTEKDEYNVGVKLSFNTSGDLICRTTDAYKGREIPENITNWTLQPH